MQTNDNGIKSEIQVFGFENTTPATQSRLVDLTTPSLNQDSEDEYKTMFNTLRSQIDFVNKKYTNTFNKDIANQLSYEDVKQIKEYFSTNRWYDYYTKKIQPTIIKNNSGEMKTLQDVQQYFQECIQDDDEFENYNLCKMVGHVNYLAPNTEYTISNSLHKNKHLTVEPSKFFTRITTTPFMSVNKQLGGMSTIIKQIIPKNKQIDNNNPMNDLTQAMYANANCTNSLYISISTYMFLDNVPVLIYNFDPKAKCKHPNKFEIYDNETNEYQQKVKEIFGEEASWPHFHFQTVKNYLSNPNKEARPNAINIDNLVKYLEELANSKQDDLIRNNSFGLPFLDIFKNNSFQNCQIFTQQQRNNILNSNNIVEFSTTLLQKGFTDLPEQKRPRPKKPGPKDSGPKFPTRGQGGFDIIISQGFDKIDSKKCDDTDSKQKEDCLNFARDLKALNIAIKNATMPIEEIVSYSETLMKNIFNAANTQNSTHSNNNELAYERSK